MAGITTLGSDCASDDTSINVVDVSQLKDNELLLIDDEIVIATAFPGEGEVDVTRAVDQTEAAAHLMGADVYPVVHVAHGGAGITVYYKDSDGSVKARTIVTVAPAIGNVRILGEPSGAGESLVSLSDTEADWEVAGGGETIQAIYSGNVVSIADGGAASLPFNNLEGTDLLDRSTPNAVKFLEDGTYAITAYAFCPALTPGGYANIDIKVAGLVLSGSNTPAPDVPFGASAVYKAAADDALDVEVYSEDGVSARNFLLARAVVVKLS